MAGSFRSARTEAIKHIKAQGVPIVHRHALNVLNAANRFVPRLEESLGYATDALKSSGHVVLPGKGDDAYLRAIGDAMRAREANREFTINPELVEPLEPFDFNPALESPVVPAQCKASVYYPPRYGMALELGWTLKSGMHPQAYFLLRAVQEVEPAFFKDCQALVKSLESIGPKEKKPRDQRALWEAGERRAARQMVGPNAGKYGPFEDWGSMVEASRERAVPLKKLSTENVRPENLGEMFERIRRAAMYQRFGD